MRWPWLDIPTESGALDTPGTYLVRRALDRLTERRIREVILVNGFWRSGTTWVQEAIADASRARTLFEPLIPARVHPQGLAYSSWTEADHQAAMPLTLDVHREALDGALPPRKAAVLWRALEGRSSGRSEYLLRKGWADALKTRVVVKFVRLSFVLDDVLVRHPMPALHVRRHPGAVLASVRRLDWHWSFDHHSTRRVYGTRHPIAATLAAYDDDPVQRVGALWALGEREAQRAIDAGRARLVVYEHALDDPGLLTGALRSLGLSDVREPRPTGDTVVTSAGRAGASKARRRDSWRDELSGADLRALEAVTTELFPACRSVWDA